MKKWFMGIDIGGTSVKIGQFNIDGKLVHKWEIKTKKEDNGKYIARDIYDSVKEHVDSLDNVIGYGFGVPGPVRHNYIDVCVNLGWKDYDLKAEFSALVNNDHIIIKNDANVATLGESYHGAGQGIDNLAMITLGTGVGGGFVLYNELYDGVNGNAGEIGHLTITSNHHFKCNCGRYNCLETHASATGVKNIYNALKENYTESALFNYEEPSAKVIFDCAKANDALALEVVDEVTSSIAYACHVFSVVTNPEVILIGGGLAKAGQYLLEQIRLKYVDIAFAPTKDLRIELATLGNDAGIYGAARMVMLK